MWGSIINILHTSWLKRITLSLVALLLAFNAGHVFSARIIIEQELSFGSLSIYENTAVRTLDLQPNGTIIADPAYIILTPGLPGRMLFTSSKASRNLMVNISITGSGLTSFSGKTADALFTIEPYITEGIYVTDQNGDLLLNLGGLLRSSGDGKTYLVGSYSLKYQVIINF